MSFLVNRTQGFTSFITWKADFSEPIVINQASKLSLVENDLFLTVLSSVKSTFVVIPPLLNIGMMTHFFLLMHSSVSLLLFVVPYYKCPTIPSINTSFMKLYQNFVKKE